jgi:hypothetical protein
MCADADSSPHCPSLSEIRKDEVGYIPHYSVEFDGEMECDLIGNEHGRSCGHSINLVEAISAIRHLLTRPCDTLVGLVCKTTDLRW